MRSHTHAAVRSLRTPTATIAKPNDSAATTGPGQLLQLQRNYGNQFVQHMLRATIQRQLVVNKPGDQYEQEADQVADAVMRMPESNEPIVQRKCASCEDEEKINVLRKEYSASAVTATPAIVHTVVQSPGQPLDAGIRSFFEPRFGLGFGGVRVHSDTTATESAAALNAQAYTVGAHIVFARGRYQPHTQAGRKLLAHELTHVVQQSKGQTTGIQRSLEGCGDLLTNNGPSNLIGGSVVHNLVKVHFNSTVEGASNIGIPGASFTPSRSQGICGGDTTVINPQITGGKSGMGFPDLARITHRGILQVAELKPADITCLIDGEVQLLGYVDQGNATDSQQAAWRAANGISVVSPMPTGVYQPADINFPDFHVKFAWCSPGLLAYTVIVNSEKVPVRKTRQVTRKNDKTQERTNTKAKPKGIRNEQPAPGEPIPETKPVKPPESPPIQPEPAPDEIPWAARWILQPIAQFIHQAAQSVENFETAAAQFLKDHPNVTTVLQGLLVVVAAGILATAIVQTIATFGAGSAADPALIGTALTFLRLAQAMN